MGNKILILGQGRHGKDTVSEILRDKYSINFMSSSWACAEVLKPVLDIINGVKSEEDHFNERHSYRELWMRLISLYNSYDKTALTKHILSKTDVYVGMRSYSEFASCVSERLFDYILYVDASKRVDYRDPTAEIGYDPQLMIKIDNNGTLEELTNYVSEVYDNLIQ
jgi:hypothetical protein